MSDEPAPTFPTADAKTPQAHAPRHTRFTRRFGNWFVNLPPLRDRVPRRYRPTLYLESLYNIGTGAFVCLFLLSGVVVKTVLDGTENHLAILAAFFGGSSLLSPVVSYLGRRVPMKSLIVYPNIVVAGLLLATASPWGGVTFFAFVVGAAFVLRVFPRVGEMNMYRVNYPATHRAAAVGWAKAIAAVSALFVTVVGYWWFCYRPEYYWVLFWMVAVMLLVASLCYARIPVSRRNIFARDDEQSPFRAFWEGLKVFRSDSRFLWYQSGFALAGFANHMAMIYVAQLLRNDVIGERPLADVLPAAALKLFRDSWGLERATVVTIVVGLIFAVLPTFLMMASAAFWGRFLDRINPMNARALFNTMQFVAYAFHAYGGMTLQLWPILIGAILHAAGNGGGTINWLTGSLYFAPEDRISLYNAVHVGLTGIRGMIAPLVGWYVLSEQGVGLGAGLFWVASGLSLAGAVVMGVQGRFDTGPRSGIAE
ncbi:MAG: hypothetical protein ACE5KM_01765 [Planctomycetaceae bacterium]